MRRFSILLTVLVVSISGVCAAAGPAASSAGAAPSHPQSLDAFLAGLAAPAPATRSNVPDFCQQPLSSCPCDKLNGWPCSQAGTHHACTTVDGFASTCTCSSGAWHCLL